MSRDARHPGKELIAHLALPLSIELTVAVSNAIEDVLTGLGYTEVVVIADGGWLIAATPPTSDKDEEQPPGGPPPAAEGAPTAPTT